MVATNFVEWVAAADPSRFAVPPPQPNVLSTVQSNRLLRGFDDCGIVKPSLGVPTTRGDLDWVWPRGSQPPSLNSCIFTSQFGYVLYVFGAFGRFS